MGKAYCPVVPEVDAIPLRQARLSHRHEVVVATNAAPARTIAFDRFEVVDRRTKDNNSPTIPTVELRHHQPSREKRPSPDQAVSVRPDVHHGTTTVTSSAVAMTMPSGPPTALAFGCP